MTMNMTMDDFLTHCTACGGNWIAMFLTGIQEIFPNDYKDVIEEVNKIGYSHGGIPAMSYLCDWLEEHGIK